MAQVTDYVIANGSGSAVRADINNVFAASKSSNSGTSAPSNAVAGTLWLDTSVSPAALKRRNAANTAWIEVSPDTVPANNLRGNPTGSAAAETNVTMTQLKTMLGFDQATTGIGWQKLPSGLILQWGSASYGPTSPSGSVNITFPTTYPTAAYIVVCTPDTAAFTTNTTINSKSASGFTFVVQSPTETMIGTINWFSVGV